MRKMLAAACTVALSLGLIAMPAIGASADEVAPPTEEVVTTTPETTAPESTTASEEPAPVEPAVEEAVLPEVVPPTLEGTAALQSTLPPAPAPDTSASRIQNTVESETKVDEPKVCNQAGYSKPDDLDSESGTDVEIYWGDPAVLVGTLTWSGMTVDYDLLPGWSIDLCIKSGSKSNPSGEKLTYFEDLVGKGTTTPIDQEISHLGFKATYTPPQECPPGEVRTQTEECEPECPPTGATVMTTTVPEECEPECPPIGVMTTTIPDECEPECPPTEMNSLTTTIPDECEEPECPVIVSSSIIVTPTDDCDIKPHVEVMHEQCEAEGDEYVKVNGSLTISYTEGSADNVAKVEYRLVTDPPSAWTEVTGTTIDDLPPGTYQVRFTAEPGYEIVGSNPIQVKINETNDKDCKKIDICHWTGNQNGGGTGWVMLNISINAVTNAGHYDSVDNATHIFDIIPPFDGNTGKNWNNASSIKAPQAFDGPPFYGSLGSAIWQNDCENGQLPEYPLVEGGATMKQATCEAKGSFTLFSDPAPEGLPSPTVLFYVDGLLTPNGTYTVTAPDTVKVEAELNNPDPMHPAYGWNKGDAQQTEWTFVFNAPAACGDLPTYNLPTLPMTGEEPAPAIAIAAFLGLIGAALVRTAARSRRMTEVGHTSSRRGPALPAAPRRSPDPFSR